MKNFVVIDTETNWYDEVMSIGAVVADGEDYSVIDSCYYLIDPCYKNGGMYSDQLYIPGAPEAIAATRRQTAENLKAWLSGYGVDTVFAYNAVFDQKHLKEFSEFQWCDIMRIAAYRQYNTRIPEYAECCKTGRLKSNYGVESIFRMLSGNRRYCEKHNGWYDAVDELKIMKMLGLPLDIYENAKL